MKERPILFSAPMVRAILDSKKTQTRRIVKLPSWSTQNWADFEWEGSSIPEIICADTGCLADIFCPYGQVGDRLWVRETHSVSPPLNRRPIANPAGYPDIKYKATDIRSSWDDGPWTPSILMKRVYSRIDLGIVSCRVERLQDISESDAMAEGIVEGRICPGSHIYGNSTKAFGVHAGELYAPSAKSAYEDLWQHINGIGSWDTNPFVWVVEFKRLDILIMPETAEFDAIFAEDGAGALTEAQGDERFDSAGWVADEAEQEVAR